MTSRTAVPDYTPNPTSASEMGSLQLDTATPNAARIYNYLLGGKDNYAADRAAAEEVIQYIPHAPAAAQQNRRFLRRAVRYLAEEQGIRQFLDIGSGLPSAGNVHEVAQMFDRDCRVVYVDYDVVAVAHAKALLKDQADHVTAIGGDVRDPGSILRTAGNHLDFTEPVAVLLFAVLHFLRDDEGPQGIALKLKEALAAGSSLAVSHITGEGIEPEQSCAAQQVYRGASAPAVPRTRAEITMFLDGLEVMEPGVTDIGHWWPEPGEPKIPLSFYGGIGRKP
jgi:O-methyltransferase involved in polyketide biosynthesis